MVNLHEPSVVLLAGSEEFLKEDALARLKSTFLDQESCDFNFNVFSADSSSAEKILECARTAPFLGRKRIVLLRGLEDFSVSDKEFILSYVKAPHKQTLLILETCESNLNQRFFSQIAKLSRLILCKPLKDKQLFIWIKARVEAQGKKIDNQAA